MSDQGRAKLFRPDRRTAICRSAGRTGQEWRKQCKSRKREKGFVPMLLAAGNAAESARAWQRPQAFGKILENRKKCSRHNYRQRERCASSSLCRGTRYAELRTTTVQERRLSLRNARRWRLRRWRDQASGGAALAGFLCYLLQVSCFLQSRVQPPKQPAPLDLSPQSDRRKSYMESRGRVIWKRHWM